MSESPEKCTATFANAEQKKLFAARRRRQGRLWSGAIVSHHAMQFGSLTLDQWDLALSAPARAGPAAAAAHAPKPLTWAARVAAGVTGVAGRGGVPVPRAPPGVSPVVLRGRRVPRAKRGGARVALPERALRGLVNCGNSCFLNVVLQALLACDPFRRLLLECRSLPVLPPLLARFARLAGEMTTGVERDAAVAVPLRRGISQGGKGRAPGFEPEPPLLPDWFHDVFPSSGASAGVGAGGSAVVGAGGSGGASNVSTSAIAGAPGSGKQRHMLAGVRGGSQEDAEEFLSFVLNGLHEELVKLAMEEDGAGYVDGSLDGSAVSDQDGVTVSASQNGNGLYMAVANGHAGSTLSNGSSAGQVASPPSPALCVRTNGTGAAHSDDDESDDGVWEEMTRKGRTVEVRGAELPQSAVTDIFGGALRSELKRPRAKLSVTREPFFSLSLDIGSGLIRDVEHALKEYFEPEVLEGYTLEESSETVAARKHVLLESLPQVLVLHLKRFSHNMVTGALNKVSRKMDFPDVLSIPGPLLYSAKAAPTAADRMYELTAVVTHIGKELAGGHYTCDVRRPGDSGKDMWVTCDDSTVTATSAQNVLRKQAYLLFYSLRSEAALS